METTQEQTEPQILSFQQEHPRLEVGGELDEDLRYSLDELRFA